MYNARRSACWLRDKELYAAYNEACGNLLMNNQPLKRSKIIKEIVENVKPHFPITYDHAYKIVSFVNAGGKLGYKSEERLTMWAEFIDYVRKAMYENEGITLSQAVARVLLTKRCSRIYLSRGYVYRHLYRVIHENRKFSRRRIA